LRKHFRTLKTKFALVDEVFCRSGNLEAGADIDEADRFDGHIRRLLPNEDSNLHQLLLFAFWAFDKKPPKFISRAKPESDQFDTSQPASAVPESKKERKRVRIVDNTESLAKAVSSLAPSNEEKEKKMELLAEQTNREKNQEKRQLQSWRRSELEKFLSSTVQLPQETKDKLEDKMNQLAEDFLMDNF
jgi:hypothetical protein